VTQGVGPEFKSQYCKKTKKNKKKKKKEEEKVGGQMLSDFKVD
jgi:hypothetical protein